MADIILESPQLFLGGTDVSANVISVQFPYGPEAVDVTKSGSGARISKNGLKTGTLTVTFAESYTDGELDEVLWTLSEAGASFAVRVRADDAAIDPGNPEYQFNAVFDGPYDLINGSVGDHMRKTVTFALAGAVTRDVAP